MRRSVSFSCGSTVTRPRSPSIARWQTSANLVLPVSAPCKPHPSQSSPFSFISLFSSSSFLLSLCVIWCVYQTPVLALLQVFIAPLRTCVLDRAEVSVNCVSLWTSLTYLHVYQRSKFFHLVKNTHIQYKYLSSGVFICIFFNTSALFLLLCLCRKNLSTRNILFMFDVCWIWFVCRIEFLSLFWGLDIIPELLTCFFSAVFLMIRSELWLVCLFVDH